MKTVKRHKTKLNMTLLCLALLTALSACGEEMAPAETKEIGSVTSSLPTETETAETVPDIPDTADYGGAVFNVEVVTPTNPAYIPIYAPHSIESENGDILNDMVYRAVSSVEDWLNIDLQHTYSKDVFDYGHLTKAAMSGDGTTDAFSYVDRFGVNQAESGYVVGYENIPTIDLDMPWWFSDINSELSIGGHLCYAVGAMNLTATSNMQCLLFNKTLYASAGFDESPYSLVHEGKWTVDTMYRMMMEVTKDLDGDGKMTAADQWGACYEPGVWYGNFGHLEGYSIIRKDQNDIPMMNVLGNDMLLTTWEKILDYVNQNTAFDVIKAGDTKIYKRDGDIYNEVLYMFNAGNSLFSSSNGLAQIALLRDMECDYGILPFPHMEEETPGTIYGASLIGGVGRPYFVPSSNIDLERTGYVFEALCYVYYKDVIGQYLDSVATVRQVRDAESAEMLTMMHSNKRVDLGTCYWYEQIGSIMYDIFRKRSGNFVSTYESKYSSCEAAIQKYVDIFLNLDKQ